VVAFVASLVGLVLLVPAAQAQSACDEYGGGFGGECPRPDGAVAVAVAATIPAGSSGGGAEPSASSGGSGSGGSDSGGDGESRTDTRVRETVVHDHHHHRSRDDEDGRDPNGTVVRHVRSVPSGGIETGGGGTLPDSGQGMSAATSVARFVGPVLALILILGGALGLRRGRIS
jgi:hypothetical protein